MNRINWIRIENEHDLEELKSSSRSGPCLLFKYSSRCASSFLVKDRLERTWNSEDFANIQPFFLDLIKFRHLSDKVAADYSVRHESPQILLIENENSFYDLSHFQISYDAIKEAVAKRKVKNEN